MEISVFLTRDRYVDNIAVEMNIGKIQLLSRAVWRVDIYRVFEYMTINTLSLSTGKNISDKYYNIDSLVPAEQIIEKMRQSLQDMYNQFVIQLLLEAPKQFQSIEAYINEVPINVEELRGL